MPACTNPQHGVREHRAYSLAGRACAATPDARSSRSTRIAPELGSASSEDESGHYPVLTPAEGDATPAMICAECSEDFPCETASAVQPTDQHLLEIASRLATEAHATQKDTSGEPYLVHVTQVADLVRAAGGDLVQQTQAWLHDVVEDTDWTLEMLRAAGFSDRVVTGVDALTKRKGQETRREAVNRAGANPDSCMVKLHGDNASNTDPARTARFAAVDPERAASLAKAYAKDRQLLLDWEAVHRSTGSLQ